MNLTPELADKIAARYDGGYTHNALRGALHDMLREHGLAILTDEAMRELILRLGSDRRAAERANARSRAHYAAERARDAAPMKHAAE